MKHEPEQSPNAALEPACPSAECGYCNGGACAKCGAGCWNNIAPLCEHDVVERHEYMGKRIRGTA